MIVAGAGAVAAEPSRRAVPPSGTVHHQAWQTSGAQSVPKPLNVTQQYDAPPIEVFALFNDPDFIAGRLEDSGAPDSEVMTVDSTADGVKIVTRQSIPASVLPSMVASMVRGDPATERTEDWHFDGEAYVAQFSVIVKGAPATIKGTMTLAPAGAGSTLVVKGEAAVPIPLFGGKIEAVIAEQIGTLLALEETYTQSRLV
jgi:hypothetical protein